MEIITLIKMLFKSKPSDFDEVQLMSMKHFPFKGYRFMMWCGRMIYREEKKDTIDDYMKSELGVKSKRHETIHLKQAQVHAKDSWIRYYWTYIKEWIKGNPIIPPCYSAYYTIPYEVEAYALDSVEGSDVNYDTTLLESKYTLKDRKKTYKENQDDWKTYVGSL